MNVAVDIKLLLFLNKKTPYHITFKNTIKDALLWFQRADAEQVKDKLGSGEALERKHFSCANTFALTDPLKVTSSSSLSSSPVL